MAKIHDIGFTLKFDEAGYFVNPCSAAKILPPWRALVDEIVLLCKHHLQSNLLSVYVRGSVARGTAVLWVSDVDAFAVIKGNRWAVDLSWIGGVQQVLDDQYPFQTGVELQCVSDREILEATISEFVRFTIKTLSTCVYGEDVSEFLPKYKFGEFLATDVRDFAKGLNDVTSALTSDGLDKDSTRAICRWIMKSFVRTGFYLVMLQEKTYSRDLYPCFKVFCKYYPEQEKDMGKALVMAVDPIDDAQNLLFFVSAFGNWLTAEIERKFSNTLLKDASLSIET